ncbi:MAG: hypothetical protein ABSG53_29080 [Thermoguttaceae bacterium]|jgi:hypothetical protein
MASKLLLGKLFRGFTVPTSTEDAGDYLLARFKSSLNHGIQNHLDKEANNPGTFANQYAQVIVFTGWAALVAIVVLAVVGCVTLIRRYGKPPTPDERQSPAAPDQPGG